MSGADAAMRKPSPGGEARAGRPGAGWRPLGVYVHWPYCVSKCPYCDFNSHVLGASPPRGDPPRGAAGGGAGEAGFLSACLKELDSMAALAPGREVASVFFGGGTPSLMAESTVAAILDRIARLWSVASDAEITLEANPSSSEAGRFAGYRLAGINRLSLGVQALNDESLRFLGRVHDSAQARAALEAARGCFPRLSFDLIYALPGQTAAAWRAELAEALARANGHLSLYQLTIERGTAFFARERAGRLRTMDADSAAALFELTQELCEAAGLPAYEVSNHAAPGDESRHNLIYWRYGAYLGVGPGAHSRLRPEGRLLALANRRDPEAWRRQVESQGHGVDAREALGPQEEAEERLIMGLRLSEGVDLDAMEAATGLRPAADALARLAEAKLIRWAPGERAARASLQGRMLLDTVIRELAASLTRSA